MRIDDLDMLTMLFNCRFQQESYQNLKAGLKESRNFCLATLITHKTNALQARHVGVQALRKNVRETTKVGCGPDCLCTTYYPSKRKNTKKSAQIYS